MIKEESLERVWDYDYAWIDNSESECIWWEDEIIEFDSSIYNDKYNPIKEDKILDILKNFFKEYMNKAMNVVVYEVFLLIILNERNAIPEEEKKQIFGLFTCLGASIGKVVIIPGGKDKKFEIVIAFARNVSKILLGLKQYATSDMEEEAQRRTDEFMVSIGIA